MVPVVIDRDFIEAHSEAQLVDVRWYLDGRDGRVGYEQGHLPGAVWVDLEHDLSAQGLPVTEGRHPFPSPAIFAAAMGRIGVGDDTTVIAYDDSGGGVAGRLVVMLRMLGRDAALLDGGLAGWDGELSTGWVQPISAQFTETPWPLDRFASANELAAADGPLMIDARDPRRFRGDTDAVDPRAGHIPGAHNAPWSSVFGPTGGLLSVEELRVHYNAIGITATSDVVAYCGSGVSACLNMIAMEHAGFAPARLFVPSWSGWSSDPTRPVATGS